MIRRSLPALFGLLALCAPPAEALVRYIAFGDSVTRGNGWPVNGDAIFDGDGPNCTQISNTDECGYSWRLEDQLIAAGIGDAEVRNYGWGGERTSTGVTRIDGTLDAECPGSPGSCSALLLMEGTNDWNTSVETVKTNLGVMIDKATTRNVDTVIASVIRRIYNPGDAWTSSLRTKVFELGAEKNRPVVDPWTPLCPTTACFNANYWLPDPNVGHVDEDGYDIMAPLWGDVILSAALPGAPSPTAPAGDVGDTTPTYSWGHLAAARWYRLLVDGPGGNVIDAWYEQAAICGGGTCAVTPTTELGPGSHAWRVLARNLRGPGPFSADTPFTVWTTPPGLPTAVAPDGDDFYGVMVTPTYQWQTAVDALQYELEVEGPGGTVVQEVYEAGDVCAGASCSATPATGLGGGSYTWEVRGLNPAGPGAYTEALPFTVYDAPPAAGIPLRPLFDRYDTQPTYGWTRVAGATRYYLRVNGPGGGNVIGGWHDAVDICDESTCQVQPAVVLAEGDHTWRVKGWNPLGNGAWTDWIDFAVLPCDPESVDLPGATVDTTISVGACVMIEVGQQGPYQIVSPGDVTFHAGRVVKIYNGFSVKSGGVFTAITDP